MSYWQRFRRFFAPQRALDRIVGGERLFATYSECLDDGPSEVASLCESLARIVGDDLHIDRVHASATGESWSVGFFDGARDWRATIEPRDYGGLFGLVNRALHEKAAPRRVHIVPSREDDQCFHVVCATIEEVQRLLDAGWNVEPGLPTVPHVLCFGGLRFAGHERYHVQAGHVFEAVLSEGQTIQGIACAAGRVSFANEGDEQGESKPVLESAVLAEDLRLACGTIRAGSQLSFWDVARRIPAAIGLNELHDFSGYPCAAGSEVSFFEDGPLLSATLGRAHRVAPGAGPFAGRTLAVGSVVWLDRDGTIESVDAPSPGV